MAPEEPCGSEFAKTMSDHLFRYENREELLAVVYRDRMTDELGRDHRGSRPRLDDLFLSRLYHLLYLLLEFRVYVWTLFS